MYRYQIIPSFLRKVSYEIEDLLKEVEKINLMPIRKKNSKRFDPLKQFIAKVSRKFIETIGSCLNGLFPKKNSCCNSAWFSTETYFICSEL